VEIAMTGSGASSVERWAVLPPAEVVATVELAPPPEIPLASLRREIVPHHDEGGRLLDWSLVPSAIDIGTIEAFRTWRTTWRRTWPLGPISNVASLRRVAERLGCDVGAGLRDVIERSTHASGGDVEVDPARATGLVDDLERVRGALAAQRPAAGGAFGIVDETPSRSRSHGLVRAWANEPVEVVLAASPVTALLTRGDDGLVLLHDGPRFGSFPRVADVDLLGDHVVVTGDGGRRLELAPEAARPLAWLAPRSVRWRVRDVPLVAVWATLLTGLPDAVRVAAAHGATVRLTTAAQLG